MPEHTKTYPRFQALPETWGWPYIARQDVPGGAWRGHTSYREHCANPNRPALVNDRQLDWLIFLVTTSAIEPGAWIEVSEHGVRRTYKVVGLTSVDDSGVAWGVKVDTMLRVETIPLLWVIGPADTPPGKA